MKFVSAIAALSVLGLIGCQQSEPETVEEAIEETADELEDAADEIEDSADPS